MSADPRTRPQVMTVVEGDHEPDYEALAIGHRHLRTGDLVLDNFDGDPVWREYVCTLSGPWVRVRNPINFDTDMNVATVRRWAWVQPRPVRPELAVGVGVRWRDHGNDEAHVSGDRYGWAKVVGRDGIIAIDHISKTHWLGHDKYETVPTDEMPPYQPPEGIEAKRPPEVTDGFEAGSRLFLSEDFNPEQWDFIARFAAAQAKRDRS